MRYLLWRLRHLHADHIAVRRGRTAFCSNCGKTFNLNKNYK